MSLILGPGPHPRADVLARLLIAQHAPRHDRLGIVVADCPEEDAVVAAQVLGAAGVDPRRRLARPLPRPGEPRLRDEDVADFLARYGHEYTVAWIAGELAGLPARTRLMASGRGAGCRIGLDLGSVPGRDEHLVDGLDADFALWTVPGDPAGTVRGAALS